MKKKIVIISVVIVLFLILFFPVKAHLDDGGSVIYANISGIYQIKKIKTYDNVGMTLTMKEGLSIKLFGKEIYYKIEKKYLAEQKDWGGSNGTCYFDAKIMEMTEDKIILESTEAGVGPIRPETPVAFDILLVSDKLRGGLWVGDEVRVMYNDKRVRVENPLWLEIVFAVYPLDETGEVISESGVTLHQGFVPDKVFSEDATEADNVWGMYTETPYSSLLLVDGAGTVELSLLKTLENYPIDLAVDQILEKAKGDTCVVFEDTKVTSGGEYWEKFLKNVQEQKNAQIRLVKYHSLGEENPYAPGFYESIKDEYPKIYFYSLVYVAGEGFWVGIRSNTDSETESVRHYNYMKYFGGDMAETGSVDAHYDRYVLVDDDTVTWKGIMEQMRRSVRMEDDIVWKEVYCNYIE